MTIYFIRDKESGKITVENVETTDKVDSKKKVLDAVPEKVLQSGIVNKLLVLKGKANERN